MATMIRDPETDSGSMNFRQFLSAFLKAKGATEILLVTTLLAFGVGSLLGLVPQTIADRYARIHHEYDGPPCNSFDRSHTPAACRAGFDEAQNSAAWANFALSLVSLISNPVVGSMSDRRGRKQLLLLAVSLASIPPTFFLVLLLIPTFNPDWYYASSTLVGVVSFLSVVFATLSDIIPKEVRAPSYGILLSAFYGGFALAPSMPLFLGPLMVAAISILLIVAAFVVAVFTVPETLAENIRQQNERQLVNSAGESNANDELSAPRFRSSLCKVVIRPILEVAILNRNRTIRLVAAGSFLSSMVVAADGTLVIYYIQEHLNVRLEDFASMFFVLGTFGIVMQGGLLQPLLRLMGEKTLLVTTLFCGTLHNLCYGIATSKGAVYLALILAQYTRMNVPLLACLASKNASSNEQGRIQGAIFAINSVAFAVGPLSMEFVYERTKDSPHLGSGFMFLYAAGLYFLSSVLVSFIPAAKYSGENANSSETSDVPAERNMQVDDMSDLEQPLLSLSAEAQPEIVANQ